MKTHEQKAVGHTAGEWEAKPYLTPEDEQDPFGVYELSIRDDLERRYLDSNDFEPGSAEEQAYLDALHAENLANARLISQAPAMLEALEELTNEASDNLENIGLPHDKAMLMLALIDNARAIIARAKGEA